MNARLGVSYGSGAVLYPWNVASFLDTLHDISKTTIQINGLRVVQDGLPSLFTAAGPLRWLRTVGWGVTHATGLAGARGRRRRARYRCRCRHGGDVGGLGAGAGRAAGHRAGSWSPHQREQLGRAPW